MSKTNKPQPKPIKPITNSEELHDMLVDTLTTKEVKELQGYKFTAYKDYKAARILFNAGCLQQACVFANTCLEKSIKACLMAFGESFRSHDRLALFDRAVKYDSDWEVKINRGFIECIANVYKSRYYSDLPVGYNYVINQNKFLAELDHTFSIIEPAL